MATTKEYLALFESKQLETFKRLEDKMEHWFEQGEKQAESIIDRIAKLEGRVEKLAMQVSEIQASSDLVITKALKSGSEKVGNAILSTIGGSIGAFLVVTLTNFVRG